MVTARRTPVLFLIVEIAMPALRHRISHFLLKKAGLFDRSYRETLYGKEFVIPIINGRKTYSSEEWMAQVLRILLANTKGAFVDVGVNLGQTMLKVAAIDPSRTYLGFEPNVACADYANALKRANGLDFTIIPAGLGHGPDILMLQKYREEVTDPSASLVAGFRDQKVHDTLPVMIIGWQQLPRTIVPEEVAVVKIDVEGGEAEVLEGVEQMLADKRPYLMVEILPAYNEANSSRIARQERIEQVLARADYTMFRIRRDAQERFSTLEQIAAIGIHGDLALSDYVMAPSERVADLRRMFAL